MHPARLDILVPPRVPTPVGHVDAAAKCQTVIDHDDLLVMRGAGRVETVQLGVNSAVSHPFRQGQDIRAANDRLKCAHIPTQQKDFQ